MLTSEQQEAVEHPIGRAAVIAVPGSGKTTVVCTKIKRELARNKRVLALTFSRKAAQELTRRTGAQAGGLAVHTVHSFALHTLSKYSKENVGQTLITPTNKWLTHHWAEKAAHAHLGKQKGEDSAGIVLDALNVIKANGISPRELKAAAAADFVGCTSMYRLGQNNVQIGNVTGRHHSFHPTVLRAASSAEHFRVEAGKRTFDDLQVELLEFLRTHSKQADELRNSFDWVFVDEFQDTDPCQAEIFKLLDNRNLFVVGDPAQAIYGFRHCNPDFLDKFGARFGEYRRFNLTYNFRSGPEILDAANKVLGQLSDNKALPIQWGQKAVPKAEVRVVRCEGQEGFVADEIERLHKDGHPYSSMAVLYRTNMQNGPIEMELNSRDIPYSVVEKSEGFFGLPTIRPIIKYLRVFADNNDLESATAILNKPNRFLSNSLTQSAMAQKAEPTVTAFLDALSKITKARTRSNVDMLRNIIHSGQQVAGATGGRLSVAQIIEEYILRPTAYQSWLSSQASSLGLSTDDALESVRTMIDKLGLRTMYSVQECVRKVDNILMRLADNRATAEGVHLTTIHRAKGLEYDSVFLIDSCDKYHPHEKATTLAEQAEELRLFFVGITRPKARLYLTYPSQTKPSPFLELLGIEEETSSRNLNNEQSEAAV